MWWYVGWLIQIILILLKKKQSYDPCIRVMIIQISWSYFKYGDHIKYVHVSQYN